MKKSLANMFSYFYFMKRELVYYLNFINMWWWFCIFKTLEKKIFAMTHNNYYHVRFHQIYNCIVADLYIQNLSQHLKQYIIHCFKYLYYQIARHILYEALHSIIELLISFHTVTADFILELFKISTSLDIMITIICKFFKKIEFISDKKIWTIIEWAKIYFAHIIN